MNKVFFRNWVSGKSESGSTFSGKSEEVRVFWQPPGPPLRIRDFSFSLYLKAEQGAEKGFLLPCCILIALNKLLQFSTILCCLLTCLYVLRMIERGSSKGRLQDVLGVPDRA